MKSSSKYLEYRHFLAFLFEAEILQVEDPKNAGNKSHFLKKAYFNFLQKRLIPYEILSKK